VPCPVCGDQTEEFLLRECVICRTLFCRRCSISGYGREFCSERCRAYFYFGDEDDLGERE